MSEKESKKASKRQDAEKDTNSQPEEHQDIEKDAETSQDSTDSNLVDWGPNDPSRPCNWSTFRIWCNLGMISSFRLLTPLASSMIAPVTNQILQDFGSSNETVGSFIVSIYILGYALGPLALAPLSEIYGRLPVYHTNNILFAIWNLASALAPNIGALLAFRLLAGLAGSSPVTIGNGSIADCVPREKRGRATAIFTAGPLLGPVVGPIAGGLLGQHVGWRWIFWVLTIVSFVSVFLAIVMLRETYEPVLLARRTQKLSQETKNPDLYHRHSNNLTKKQVFARAINRPLIMLFTSPAVLITSIYVGLVYGYTCLLFTSFGSLFTTIYNFSESTVGLTYLGFGVGCATGLLVLGTVSDRIVKRFSPEGGWKAEYRLLPLIPGSLVVPIGLFWYGWSAEENTHWIVPIIGTAFVGIGTLAVFMPVQSYLIDAFPLYAASAAAANTILRSLAGAFLPLAGPALYQSLGQGWCVDFSPSLPRALADIRKRQLAAGIPRSDIYSHCMDSLEIPRDIA